MSKRLRLVIFPLWCVVTMFAIAGGLLFLTRDSRSAKLEAARNGTDMDTQTYQLFAAVPRTSKAQVLGQRIDSKDIRVIKTQRFLEYFNSPLAPHAETMVVAADAHEIPWTLLAAIACKESGCGRILPRGSHNAWGWAIYTGQNSGAAWDSWDDAIWRVSEGIRTGYFDQGLDTIPEIETRYTPQSAQSHHGWRDHVTYFTELLEEWEI